MINSQSNSLFWGVDVASNKLDVGCYGVSEVRTFDNTPAGVAELLEWVTAQPLALLVIEATGGYETNLVVQADNAGLPVVLANPRQLRSFATAIGELAKTDAIDARIIARFAHDVRPELRPFPTENQRFFADLAARRRQLIELRTAEKNRRQQTLRPQLRVSIDAVIEVIDAQITALEKQLAELIATNSQWQQRDQILQSVAGIAAATSHILIADLPELGRLSHKQISKLVGVAPLNRDSGKFRGRRTVWGGRSDVRAALYMAAFNAIRCNNQIRTFYQRLRQAGKCYKVAITACMRKLLTILNALVRDDATWRKPTMTT
jgi:transposase